MTQSHLFGPPERTPETDDELSAWLLDRMGTGWERTGWSPDLGGVRLERSLRRPGVHTLHMAWAIRHERPGSVMAGTERRPWPGSPTRTREQWLTLEEALQLFARECPDEDGQP